MTVLTRKYETFRDDFEANIFSRKMLSDDQTSEDSGLTQTEFAKNAGMTQGNLSGSKKQIIIRRSRIFKKLRVKMGMI